MVISANRHEWVIGRGIAERSTYAITINPGRRNSGVEFVTTCSNSKLIISHDPIVSSTPGLKTIFRLL